MSVYPLISVVLPVYNCALYIQEAIDSILNQTVQDFEIIIIDDCSVDDTVKIIQTIEDSRIKLILKEKNKGLIDSLNLGFREARGKYITRMDGDDINFPERFQKQLEVLENNAEIQVCGCWLQCFDTSSKVIKYKEFHEEIQAYLLLSNSMSLCSAMLSTEAFKNFLFDSTKVHVEDYDFWARTVFDYKFYNIQEPLYYYRVHEKQVSTKYKAIQIQGDISIKLFLFKKLDYDTNRYSDELIKKMLLLDEYIKVKELTLFIHWLKEITFLNNKSKIFSENELKSVLNVILRSILFILYFKTTDIGINKKWRIYALFKLPFKDSLYILKSKTLEMKRLLLRYN